MCVLAGGAATGIRDRFLGLYCLLRMEADGYTVKFGNRRGDGSNMSRHHSGLLLRGFQFKNKLGQQIVFIVSIRPFNLHNTIDKNIYKKFKKINATNSDTNIVLLLVIKKYLRIHSSFFSILSVVVSNYDTKYCRP